MPVPAATASATSAGSAGPRSESLPGTVVHDLPCLPAVFDGPPSWEQLFRLYGPYVAQVALRVLGRDDEVDDVVQEVFLSVMSDIEKLRNPLSVRGWLKTVTVRKAYRVLKQRGRRRLWAFFGLGDSAELAVAGSTYPLTAPGCSAEERVLLLRIYRLLDELPAHERLAWTLRYIEGEQVESVATLCGCSLATVKRRIAAAQTFLARTLDDA
jgi:RNA polymerase sigma-70 factor (ECF subfamily)